MQDYIEENKDDRNYFDLPEQYKITQFKRQKCNQDQHKNSYGEKLIDLATSTNMKILNGRTIGDLMGKYTYIGYNGVSTVDYVLGSEDLLLKNYIHSFEVEEFTLLSDHRPTCLTLQYSGKTINVKEVENIHKTIPKKKRIHIRDYSSYEKELHKNT